MAISGEGAVRKLSAAGVMVIPIRPSTCDTMPVPRVVNGVAVQRHLRIRSVCLSLPPSFRNGYSDSCWLFSSLGGLPLSNVAPRIIRLWPSAKSDHPLGQPVVRSKAMTAPLGAREIDSRSLSLHPPARRLARRLRQAARLPQQGEYDSDRKRGKCLLFDLVEDLVEFSHGVARPFQLLCRAADQTVG